MSTNAFPDVSVMDEVFDLHALLQPEEIEWAMKARTFAQTQIRPVIEDDFDKKYFRKELIPLIAEQGFLGMHLKGYGCAGASAVSYGLVCLETEAVDSGWRTFISVMGSLAMSAIYKYDTEEQKNYWLPQMAKGEKLGCFGLTEPQGGSDPANMLTTATMIRLGRVRGNRMVDMQLSNDKLIDRGTRMVAEELGIDAATAKELLLQHGSVRKAVEAFKG